MRFPPGVSASCADNAGQLLDTSDPEAIVHAASPPPDYRDRYEALTGISLRTCPLCGAGRMLLIEHLTRLRLCPPITDTS